MEDWKDLFLDLSQSDTSVDVQSVRVGISCRVDAGRIEQRFAIWHWKSLTNSTIIAATERLINLVTVLVLVPARTITTAATARDTVLSVVTIDATMNAVATVATLAAVRASIVITAACQLEVLRTRSRTIGSHGYLFGLARWLRADHCLVERHDLAIFAIAIFIDRLPLEQLLLQSVRAALI